jgi:murein DD-endopeptidase MepM/ murein hydrolase activator NlpD
MTGDLQKRRLAVRLANAASIVGIICGLGAAGWYFSAQDTPQIARRTTVTPAAVLAAKVKAKLAVREVAPEVLLSLARVEHAVAARRHTRIMRVLKGDNFMRVLRRAGVPAGEARAALTTLAGVYDTRKIRPGHKISIAFGIYSGDTSRFLGLRFDSTYDRTIRIQRQKTGEFVAAQTRKDLSMRLVRGNGIIETSLFQAGLAASVPASRMIRVIHLFSFQVDFQRDIKKGDAFEILYRIHKDHTGQVVRHGEIIYAALTLSGAKIRMYRFPNGENAALYLNEKGESNRRALMRTPIDGARLSSGFGFRRHPVLGYSKLHAGVDFAAPRGTPIYAAGDGTIEKQGWWGGYGRYIRVRHNREYSTAYAHMTRFAKGMYEGKRVKQGQVIGYVGSTGRSTGPHLHYEVLRYGKQMNPMKLTLPAFKSLKGDDLKRFLRFRERVDNQYVALKKNGGAGRLIRVKAEAPNSGCTNGRRLDPTNQRPCPKNGRAQ